MLLLALQLDTEVVEAYRVNPAGEGISLNRLLPLGVVGVEVQIAVDAEVIEQLLGGGAYEPSVP